MDVFFTDEANASSAKLHSMCLSASGIRHGCAHMDERSAAEAAEFEKNE